MFDPSGQLLLTYAVLIRLNKEPRYNQPSSRRLIRRSAAMLGSLLIATGARLQRMGSLPQTGTTPQQAA